MPEGYGPSVGIPVVHVDLLAALRFHLPYHAQILRRKRLIAFDHIQI